MNLEYSLRFQKLQQSRRILSTKLGHFQGIFHLALGIPASLYLQGFASFLNNEHPDSSFAVFLRVGALEWNGKGWVIKAMGWELNDIYDIQKIFRSNQK